MILQVLANFGQIEHSWNAQAFQESTIADTTQFEQLDAMSPCNRYRDRVTYLRTLQ